MSDHQSDAEVAIITGAGQGIGKAIAMRLAEDGYRVVIADLKRDKAAKAVEEIQAKGLFAIAIPTDVANEDARRLLIDLTIRELGRLDVLVNNAAIQQTSHPLEVSESHWDLMMNVNAKSVWFLSQIAIRHMISKRTGRVVNIASAAGKIASSIYHPVYNVAKASVIAMTKTLAHASAEHGVRVNCVCPGVIDTEMGDQVANEFAALTGKPSRQILQERIDRVPMKKMGTPNDVAAVVSFLAGRDSSYMTGQAINVTGGMVTY